jgi:hypothetical protein
VVSEIIRGWNAGIGCLVRRYQILFQGTIHICLNKNIHLKLMWLASVWAACDRIFQVENALPDPLRNVAVTSFFQRRTRRVGHNN